MKKEAPVRKRRNTLITLLRTCRERYHLSQRQLARKANVPDECIRDLEDHEKLPRKDHLFRIGFAVCKYPEQLKEVFPLIHELCETRKARRRRLYKLLRHPLNRSDLHRFRRLREEF
jgi:DNA-binding XRE family transcriptional regulator